MIKPKYKIVTKSKISQQYNSNNGLSNWKLLWAIGLAVGFGGILGYGLAYCGILKI